MPATATQVVLSDHDFTCLVDALAREAHPREQLTDLLREDHPIYRQRGAASIVQMRGWILLALGRVGISDQNLLFVLEELDVGVDAYLVAAAACALRSYPTPNAALTPFVMRALNRFHYHDEPVSFDGYGEYPTSSAGTTPVCELLATLAWLGPCAFGVLSEIEAVVRTGALSKHAAIEARRTLEAIRTSLPQRVEAYDCCALPFGLWRTWAPWLRRSSDPIESTVFEDHDGRQVTFNDFLHGRPAIVVFFYTRCDNPLKCSLTIAKLARVQKLLQDRGLDGQIRTAAITYDPAFDVSQRLRRYGSDRGVRMDGDHRILRAPEGMARLREHFRLRVTFIESLVSRHRIEAFVLDREGRVAAAFERLQWDERTLVDRATDVVNERGVGATPQPTPRRSSPMWDTFVAAAIAFFPKCLVCWAAYLSLFGIAGVAQVTSSPWLEAILAIALLVNVSSVWFRGWSTGRVVARSLVTAGAVMILIGRAGFGWKQAATAGVLMTLAGSLLSAMNWRPGLLRAS